MTAVFTTTGSALSSGAWATRVVAARPVVPVMAGVVIETVGEDKVSFTASDPDVTARATIPADVTTPGRFLVSGALFAAIAKTIKDTASVAISTDDTFATVTVGKSSWQLPLLGIDDYPAVTALPDLVGTVDAAALAHAIARVTPATSTAPPFNGAVDLRATADGPFIVNATDSFRIACADVDWTPTFPHHDIPRSCVPVGLLKTMFAAIKETGATGSVGLHIAPTIVGLATDTHAIAGRVMEQPKDGLTFRLDPSTTTFPTSITVRCADLKSATERVAVILGGKAYMIAQVDSDGVTLFPMEAEKGGAEQHCPVLDFTGDPTVCGLNAPFLLDALASLDSENALIEWGPNRRLLMRPATAEGAPLPGFDHIVMQVRTPERWKQIAEDAA